jgi:hypothetical protein
MPLCPEGLTYPEAIVGFFPFLPGFLNTPDGGFLMGPFECPVFKVKAAFLKAQDQSLSCPLDGAVICGYQGVEEVESDSDYMFHGISLLSHSLWKCKALGGLR